MKSSPFLSSVIAVPGGLLVSGLFIWLFGIDIPSTEKISAFPENWSFMNLAAIGFALMMFGSATRVIYRLMTGKYDEASEQESDQNSIPFDR